MTTSSTAARPATSGFPLKFAAPEVFARVHADLLAASFDDATLCRELHMDDMSDLGQVVWEGAVLDRLAPPLRCCLEVFVRGRRIPIAELVASCGESLVAGASALGLLRPAKHDPAALLCPVWLYPVDGFLVASDRRDDPDGDPFEPPEDVVFPAIYAGTLRFLQLLPDARDAAALDLCGGSGIGALRLARTARSAATADLTARSAAFSEFNARLNGLQMESLCGDLYEPVAGRMFDVITAHPPFVPSTGQNMIYRDVGETGENVTIRVIAGLPAHLRPGGRCLVWCVARDTDTLPLERRVQEWLGPAQAEFDVVFALEKVLRVEEVVESMRRRGQRIDDQRARRLHERLRGIATKQFVYGGLLIERCREPHALPPLRIGLALEATREDLDRLMRWRAERRAPDFSARLARSRPRLAPALELTVRHVVRDGELVPAEFTFSAQGAFRTGLRLDGWIVPLIARLTGNESVGDVFEHARSASQLPAGFPLSAWVELIAGLVEKGFLEAEGGQGSTNIARVRERG